MNVRKLIKHLLIVIALLVTASLSWTTYDLLSRRRKGTNLMKNLSRLTFISLCILFVTSCGGGGGGSGGSGSGQTSASYQYDPIASTYANKAWDSITMAKLNRVDGYYADYAFNVQSTLVENSSVGYDVTLDGQGIYTEEVISYDWSITEENTSVVDLYDSSGFVKAQSGTQNFSNAEVKIISGDVTWLANNLIQYTNLSFTEIDVYGGRKDTFPLVYGDKKSSLFSIHSDSHKYCVDAR